MLEPVLVYFYLSKQEVKIMNNKPFKFRQHIGHKDPALHSFVYGVVVLKEGKHVPAVLHGQTSDELLNHLKTKEARYQQSHHET